MRTTLVTPEAWTPPLTSYLARLASLRRSEGTIRLTSYHLRRFAVTTGLQPFAVALEDVEAYLARATWGASTVRSHARSLRGFYEWAHATGRTPSLVTEHLGSASAPRGTPRPAAEDAVSCGLHDVDARTRLMVKLGAHAGLRCCEIARVHTRDVQRGVDGAYLRVLGKGRKVRLLPLPAGLAADLRALPEGWAFPGQIDGHLSASYVSKLISRALPEGVTAHMLRHRFASRTYTGTGKDIRAVQELLGHASVATTQIYTYVESDTLRRGVEFAAA
ncbi:tyrosine-type recombinase/integrase [Rathayibacter sp. AY1A7]|uniref:tyrosine-type recombinase/integrase n=1 Tax=Rathayibacter sp. AY1A7 TaxID=2080524 RepID=UPI0015E3A321|nr:tyrosine-type recombinase/integrase [Rathayibacter sp. AY1A7]